MNFTKHVLGTVCGVMLMTGAAWAQKGETVKIAWIDPLSGPFANIGQNSLKTFQFMAEKVNANNPAGVKFEIVSFDNKASPQESLTVLKAAIDQGIRFVTQGNGSGAAGAIIDAINKHNERNPGKEVVFFNNAAVDPDLTNSKCSFWHFRFDADTSMKMEALTSYMKDEKNVKKVYIIGQNYAHGHQVAKFFKEALARKRPDVQIVGEDLHPIGQVKDFAPYIAKIKASGADSVVTGNWGTDLSLLIKAAKDAGLEAMFYTYYGGEVRLCRPPEHPRGVQAGDRVQRQVQGRPLAADHHARAAGAGRWHRQGQEHRSGEGRDGDGGPDGQEFLRRRDDPRGRPPTAAAAVHRHLEEAVRPEEAVERRRHRLHLGAGQGLRALRVEHADLVPDEASGRLIA
jgi:Periplasmic binding protein